MTNSEIINISKSNGISYVNGSTRSLFFLYNHQENPCDSLVHCASYCREVFSDYFSDKNLTIGYSVRSFISFDFDKLVEFFNILETKLELTEKTVFHKTDINNIVIISVPEYWRQCSAARGFFTLFLRCGAEYYHGNFDNALIKYELTAKIPKTINHFLSGNKNYSPYVASSLDGSHIVGFFYNAETLYNTSISQYLTK